MQNYFLLCRRGAVGCEDGRLCRGGGCRGGVSLGIMGVLGVLGVLGMPGAYYLKQFPTAIPHSKGPILNCGASLGSRRAKSLFRSILNSLPGLPHFLHFFTPFYRLHTPVKSVKTVKSVKKWLCRGGVCLGIMGVMGILGLPGALWASHHSLNSLNSQANAPTVIRPG